MSHSILALIFIAVSLGIRHGFDWDHLAIIDSITRTLRHRKKLSRFTGILFALGHGMVVIIISLLMSCELIHSTIPHWLDPLGHGISIFFLLIFGCITLWNVFQREKKTPLLKNIRFLLVEKIINKNPSAFLIIFIGALFAFSFDTFSQIALFSLSANFSKNYFFSLLLATIFMIGMMISDGLNGFFVSFLVQRADRFSFFISRFFGGIIGFLSLGLGVFNFIILISQ